MLRILIFSLFFLFLVLPRSETASGVKRLTDTPEHSLNLNPSLSDDGRTIVFESTSDAFGDGSGGPFHAVRADVRDGTFIEMASTRMVSPALSSDGRVVAFASTEDLVGQNADRNSEIFLFDGARLRQITSTQPASVERRLIEGNWQPSISSDGRFVAYCSNGQIFLFDNVNGSSMHLTHGESPKISGDGSRIYFTTDASDLFVIDRQTRATIFIKSAVMEFAVSKDGMRVVYSASTQVFLYDARDNSTRQLTQLGTRSTDVKLQPTISGDGKRVAFATRRRVTNTSDGSVELYVLDLPTGQVQQITNAPSRATAEVVSAMNYDGSLIAFSFPRLLSGATVNEDFENNSEIYVASVAPRAAFAAGTVLNAASLGHEPEAKTHVAPGSIATFRGDALAFRSERAAGGDPPLTLAGTTVTVNEQPARIFYVSPGEVIFVMPDNAAPGSVEVVVTNSEGFSSKAEVTIAPAAPGIFTVTGDGRGEGIILDADTMMAGPFDPSNSQRRLSIFVTGVNNASSVKVSIRDQNAIVEAVERSGLSGLDEIHVLLPSQLQGAGASTLIVEADGVRSNPVSLVIAGAPPVAPATVVISQIFGGGGNSGAPYRNDFIEIFNAGDVPVNLAGWSIQYASATASTWSTTPLNPIVLAPGQYYLIQQAGGSNGAQLPTPDATGTIAMAAGSGKVALVKSTAALTGACPSDPNIVDLVGYGSTASCFQGAAPSPAAGNTNAATRKTNGCTDTRNNANDFALATPNARNTSAPFNTCTIARSVLPCFADALAQRRDHDFAPTLRLRRFP